MNLDELLKLIPQVGAPLISVIIGMKYAINGMRKDVIEIKSDVKEVKGTLAEHSVDIAVLKARHNRRRSGDTIDTEAAG